MPPEPRHTNLAAGPDLKIVIVEITYDANRTTPAKVYDRIVGINGVWDAEDLSQ